MASIREKNVLRLQYSNEMLEVYVVDYRTYVNVFLNIMFLLLALANLEYSLNYNYLDM